MKLFNPDRLFYSRASRGPASTDRDQSSMTLYCWRCNGPHVLLLPDVEKIVYALGPAPTDAYFSGYDDGGDNYGLGAEPTRSKDEQPTCWLEVLRWADDSEMYAEHVEQGIECREKS